MYFTHHCIPICAQSMQHLCVCLHVCVCLLFVIETTLLVGYMYRAFHMSAVVLEGVGRVVGVVMSEMMSNKFR